MSKGFKIIGIGILAALIIIQFFRPEKNSSPVDPATDFIQLTRPSEKISTILTNACYDCHSNQTDYPWYNRISPVAWYLNKHIREGKEHLNYSEYGSLDKADRIRQLVKICEELESGSMPLKSYKLIHRDARLTREDIALICEWTEEVALKVLQE
jgi:hypothetical protein